MSSSTSSVIAPSLAPRGLFADACEHIDAGLSLYDEGRDDRHRYLYLGHDPAVCAPAIDAPVQWLLGYPARAINLERAAVALAQRLGHAPCLRRSRPSPRRAGYRNQA